MSKKKQAGKYFVFGMTNTIIGYAIYEVLALTVFRGDLLPAASAVSGFIGIFTGYFLHSRFTWKGREIGKKVLGKFFIWNVFMFLVKPLLTAFFRLGVFVWLYTLAFNICQFLHIPFSFEFVSSTGNFVLMTAVTMVVNFLIYDRFVFGKKGGKKVEVESVRETGKEEE